MKVLIVILMMFSTAYAQEELSVMSFNIRLDTENDGINQWNNRKEFVANHIAFYAPAFLGVQEALPNQMDYLTENLTGYNPIGVGREDGKRKGEFSAIFYRPQEQELLCSGTFWLSETPDVVSTGWDAALPRVCTWGMFKSKESKKRVLVMNTHFDHVGKTAREKSVELILLKAKELSGGKNVPVILMGDLNLEPETTAIQLVSNQLQDSRLAAGDQAFGPEGTFTGWKTTESPTRRIDYIFYSENEFTLKQYGVLSHVRNQQHASDHLPVFVRLQRKKKRN